MILTKQLRIIGDSFSKLVHTSAKDLVSKKGCLKILVHGNS